MFRVDCVKRVYAVVVCGIGLVLSVAVLAGVCFPAQEAQTPQALLLHKLFHKEAVSYLALGDSITYGYELPHPAEDSYAARFAQLLTDVSQNPRFRYVNGGVSGDTVSDGLSRLPRLLQRYHPDLMSVQFGGNDFRLQTPLDEFSRDLRAIIALCREQCNTAVVFITPPMADDAPEHDASVVQKVREIAEEEDVPVLDADTLLKQAPHDYRGLFPYKAHPTVYSHRQMAIALWDTLSKWLKCKSPVSVELETRSSVSDGGRSVRVAVLLKNVSQKMQPCKVSLWVSSVVQQTEVLLRADEQKRVTIALPLSVKLNKGRSLEQTLRACVATRDGYDCDMKSLVVSPLVQAKARSSAAPAALPLGFWNVVIGDNAWDGPEDLSAEFQIVRDTESLEVEVRVRDDRISPASQKVPHDGDSVELYLDLRKAKCQGEPFYTGETLILYAIPGDEDAMGFGGEERDSGDATIITSEPEPKQLSGATATYTLVPEGYTLAYHIPLPWFQAYGSDAPPAFGFDVVVNDGDDNWGRDTQMVWAGTEKDYLNPLLFAGLALEPAPPHASLRITIQ